MENYYDVATPEELEEQYGYKPSAKELKADRAYCEQDPDYNYQYLFWLYRDRGQMDRAQSCFDKIKSPQRRLDAKMMAFECRG